MTALLRSNVSEIVSSEPLFRFIASLVVVTVWFVLDFFTIHFVNLCVVECSRGNKDTTTENAFLGFSLSH